MSKERPRPLSEAVSRQFSRMPTQNSAPELSLRSELHRRGLRYRVGVRSLPGTPDVAFTRAKLAVFVDGCFWHRCPEHAVAPKNNAEWWANKFDANRERDQRKNRELIALGWIPLHVWEHEDVVEAADRIEALWRRRTEL